MTGLYHISDIHIRNYIRQEEYEKVFENLCNKIIFVIL